MDFAARVPASAHAGRVSMHRLRQQPAREPHRALSRERILILATVVIAHALLLVALHALMRPPALVRGEVEEPLWITIISPPAKPQTMPAPIPPRATRAEPDRSSRRADTLRAVLIAPSSPSLATDATPRASLYDADGGLRLPLTIATPKRSPFERPRASTMLPGADGQVSALAVRPGASPQQWVERVGSLFGGGHFDPCPELQADALNTDDPDQRERDLERMQRACPGK